MPQSIFSIRMDDTLKSNFEYVCNELGLNMSTAITIFAKKVCREKRIPFEVSIDPKCEKGSLKMNKKTYYYVHIYPEYTEGSISVREACFDNLEDAYKYLVINRSELQDEINNESGFYKHLAFFNIGITTNELFDPKSEQINTFKFEYTIGCSAEEGIFFRHEGINYDINFPEDSQEAECMAIYGFLKSLQTMQIIN